MFDPDDEIVEATLEEKTNEPTQTTKAELLDLCGDLAEQPRILHVLDEDLRTKGFAGSTAIPRLVFLSLYSRVLERPVNLLIKGPSGSGKSFSLMAGKQYVPEKSAYEEFHGMSERALLYLEKLNLKHRYLIIQEAAGLNNGVGRVFLRQLLSEGKVNYATVQNTDEGLVGKRLPKLEGPTGCMMTTTERELHFEDETRFLSIHVDENPERMREALRRQALGAKVAAKPEDLSSWHALHDLICENSLPVKIPYASLLAEAMPLTHQRVQRDFPQLLSLLTAHAQLHQFTRKTEDGEIVATLDDYEAVYDLIAAPMAEGLEAAVPPHVRRVVEAVAKINEQEAFPPDFNTDVSQLAVAKILKIHRSSVSRAAHQAIDMGFLRDETPGQGRESTLVLGERPLPNGYALPSPHQLAQMIAETQEVTD